jgi:predicted MFS family arabinose efflux permease
MGRFGGVKGTKLGGLLLSYKLSASQTFMVFAIIPFISAILISFSIDLTRKRNEAELANR